VARELAGRSAAATAGERQFQQLGLTGARGEAESGFATVRRVLPQWNGRQLHDLLLRLMAVNPDSNLVSRGGIQGCDMFRAMRERCWLTAGIAALLEMDKALINVI
jgi:triphosphoribosyl-dephospho-CoA synthase